MLERSRVPVRLVPEPKPGGIRWLARLEPTMAAAYAASVVPLVPAIERALPPAVVANRVLGASVEPPGVRLEPWRAARARFRELVRTAGVGAGAALMADVRDCYGSIRAPALGSALDTVGAEADAVEGVLAILRRLTAFGVRGLPIGPEASAVLANGVLLRVDQRLAERGWAHVRWVDDLIVFTADVAGAQAALDVVRETLAELDLALAEHKTRVVVDPAAIRGGGPAPPSGLGPRSPRPSG